MIPRSCFINAARDRAQFATPAPVATFKCRCCGKHKPIPGRKLAEMIGKRQVWHCAECVRAAKPEEIAAIVPATGAWELIDEPPAPRMLTSAELKAFMSFDSPFDMIAESPPCAHFAKPNVQGDA